MHDPLLIPRFSFVEFVFLLSYHLTLCYFRVWQWLPQWMGLWVQVSCELPFQLEIFVWVLLTFQLRFADWCLLHRFIATTQFVFLNGDCHLTIIFILNILGTISFILRCT